MAITAHEVDPSHTEALPQGWGSDGTVAHWLQTENRREEALKRDQDWLGSFFGGGGFLTRDTLKGRGWLAASEE